METREAHDDEEEEERRRKVLVEVKLLPEKETGTGTVKTGGRQAK